MDDIRRRNWAVFGRALLKAGPLTLLGVGLFLLFMGLNMPGYVPGISQIMGMGIVIFSAAFPVAYLSSLSMRFNNKRYQTLWEECDDRRKRLHVALKGLRKRKLADFEELPNTVDNLANQIYVALRKADLVEMELIRSEGNRKAPSAARTDYVADPQAQELFRLADRNMAEYNQAIRVVTNSIDRTEGQAAVYITTLDNLRARILNYRLAGRSPEADNQEFLILITESKMQFEAIDKALDELELTPFPKQISVMAPSPYQHLNPTTESQAEEEEKKREDDKA